MNSIQTKTMYFGSLALWYPEQVGIMDPLQLPEFCRFHDRRIEMSAKAQEVFARCVAEIEREDTPLDEQDVVRINTVASRLNTVAVSESGSSRRYLGIITCKINTIVWQCRGTAALLEQKIGSIPPPQFRHYMFWNLGAPDRPSNYHAPDIILAAASRNTEYPFNNALIEGDVPDSPPRSKLRISHRMFKMISVYLLCVVEEAREGRADVLLPNTVINGGVAHADRPPPKSHLGAPADIFMGTRRAQSPRLEPHEQPAGYGEGRHEMAQGRFFTHRTAENGRGDPRA